MDANETIVACVAPFLRRNEVQLGIFVAFTPDQERRGQDEPPPSLGNTLLPPSSSSGPRHQFKVDNWQEADIDGPTRHNANTNPNKAHDSRTPMMVSGDQVAGRMSVGSQVSHQNTSKYQIRDHSQTHKPVLTSDVESAVMAIEVVGLDKIITTISKRKGEGWSEAIHGVAGRYICQIVDIVDSFGGEIAKFMGDLMYVKWDLSDNANARARDIVECVTCGVQLLTELADYTVEHQAPQHSQPMIQASKNGGSDEAALLEYAGVGSAFDQLVSTSSPPITLTLRMKLAVIVGNVSNVILGTWERMDYSLYGPCIDELADILLSCPIGELQVPVSVWQSIQSISGVLIQTVIATNDKTVSLSRFQSSSGPYGKQRPNSSKPSRSGSMRNQNRRKSLTSDNGFDLNPSKSNSSGGSSGGDGDSSNVKRDAASRPWRRAPAMRRLSEGDEANNNSSWFLLMHARLSASRPASAAGYAKARTLSVNLGSTKSLLLSTLVNRLLVDQIGSNSGPGAEVIAPKHTACVVMINVLETESIEPVQKALLAIIETIDEAHGVFHQWFSARNQRILTCLFGFSSDPLVDDHDVLLRQCTVDAVRFCSSLLKNLKDQQVSSCIGIVQGESYFTMVGNMIRSDAFLLNAGIGKFLKLLAIPEAANKIICCENTQVTLTSSAPANGELKRFTFPMLGKFMVRGSAKAIPVTELVDTGIVPSCWQPSRNPFTTPVGMEKHIERLREAFMKWKLVKAEDSTKSGRDSTSIVQSGGLFEIADSEAWTSKERFTFVVTAPAGHGKTLLANEIAYELDPTRSECTTFVTFCPNASVPDHGQRASFGALRRTILKIARSVCESAESLADEKPAEIIDKAFRTVGLDSRLAAVAAASIGSCENSHWPFPGWEDEISAKDRADVTIAATISMIQYGLQKGRKYFIVVDDFQAFVVIFSRPVQPGSFLEADFQKLMALPGIQTITLDRLSTSNISELFKNQWGGRGAGIKKVDASLCETVYRVTEGDPLFTSLLCKVLRTRSSVGKAPAQNAGLMPTNAQSAYDTLVSRGNNAPGGFSLYDTSPSDNKGLTRKTTLSQSQGQGKEDLPSPLIIDDDGILRSRRWPALDLSGANFNDLILGIFERSGFNTRRIMATASVFGQGFTIHDILAGTEGINVLEEVILALEEDTEKLITCVKFLDPCLLGYSSPTEKIPEKGTIQIKATPDSCPIQTLGFRSAHIAQIIYDAQNFLTKQTTHAKVATYLQGRWEKMLLYHTGGKAQMGQGSGSIPRRCIPSTLLVSRIAYHREKANDIVGVMSSISTLAKTSFDSHLLDETRVILQKLIGLAGAGWGSLDNTQRAEWLVMLATTYRERGDTQKAQEALYSAFKLLKVYYPATVLGKRFLKWRSSNRMKKAISIMSTSFSQSSRQGDVSRKDTSRGKKKKGGNGNAKQILSSLFSPSPEPCNQSVYLTDSKIPPLSTAARAFHSLHTLHHTSTDGMIDTWLAFDTLASAFNLRSSDVKLANQREEPSTRIIVESIIPVMNCILAANSEKRRRNIRSMQTVSSDGQMELFGANDLEGSCSKLLLDLISKEPPMSPLTMEALLAYGHLFLSEGYIHEAHKALIGCLEIASAMDEWNIWSKAALGLCATGTFLSDASSHSRHVASRANLLRYGAIPDVRNVDSDDIILSVLGSTFASLLFEGSDADSGSFSSNGLDIAAKLIISRAMAGKSRKEGMGSIEALGPKPVPVTRVPSKKITPDGSATLAEPTAQSSSSYKEKNDAILNALSQLPRTADTISVSTKVLAYSVAAFSIAITSDIPNASKAFTACFQIGSYRSLQSDSKRYKGIPAFPLTIAALASCAACILYKFADKSVSGENASEWNLALVSVRLVCSDYKGVLKLFRKLHGLPEVQTGGVGGQSKPAGSPTSHLEALAVLSEALIDIIEAGGGKPTDKTVAIANSLKPKLEALGYGGNGNGERSSGFISLLGQVVQAVATTNNSESTSLRKEIGKMILAFDMRGFL
ncbi:hypothetical protein HDU97_001244 [Phlyctochytrium planicorne]|nr:hypothetical protein HDU97_001244 [Phlyctochytrium planicorne]